MKKADLMCHEIWVCKDREEAKKVWNEFPQDRHRIWLEEETWIHCLDDPEELQVIIDKKILQPGVY